MSRERRRPRGKKINPTIHVFCEGKTEESYVNFLKARYRIPTIQIQTKVSGNSINQRKVDAQLKGRPAHEKDITFLLYDLDAPKILRRLQAISNCTLLVSNPCIELWFLLHFKSQTASVDAKYCHKELTNRDKQYKKGMIDEKLKKCFEDKEHKALERAKKLMGTSNPSSSVYKLIEYLNELRGQGK